jgi:hydrogenase expression/formation protein HypD
VTEGANSLLERIAELHARIGRPVQLMEVCGTHTVSLFRSGVRQMLPAGLAMLSGPGCPVCVTSQGYFDAAADLADRPDVTLCTYGDMLRVPGRRGSLESLRGQGADVAIVYSARDALAWARQHPDRQVVFLAVGFETTAPATAATLIEAHAAGAENFSVLPGHKLVLPAMRALLADPDVRIDGFLCPGHVSVVLGSDAYRPIAEEFGKPCAVAGFEPAGMLAGIASLLEQLDEDNPRVENCYPAAVSPGGNPVAKQLIDQIFTSADADWRAMGTLPDSGLELRDDFRRYDARQRFNVTFGPDEHPPGCRCGEVIQGKVIPADCSLFAADCTPVHPVGPCMVSSEGTCAAWMKFSSRP